MCECEEAVKEDDTTEEGDPTLYVMGPLASIFTGFESAKYGTSGLTRLECPILKKLLAIIAEECHKCRHRR